MEEVITAETVANWKFRERAHYNGGKEWFGYGYQCIENPRLGCLDRYKRADRSVTREWQVDGATVADFDEAVRLLNEPVSITDEEQRMLALLLPAWMRKEEISSQAAFASFESPWSLLSMMGRKGLVEWENGRVRALHATTVPSPPC